MEGVYYIDKYTHKELRHANLQTLGYEVILLPIVLGVTIAIYKASVTALNVLGIERDKAKKSLKELHLHAMMTHHTIINLRKSLRTPR